MNKDKIQVGTCAVAMALERYEGNDNYKASGVCWPLLSSLGASKKKRERERERERQRENDRLRLTNYHSRYALKARGSLCQCLNVFYLTQPCDR